MKTMIVGAGRVGCEIATVLVAEGHDVIVVERDLESLTRTTDVLDIQGVRGHGARPSVLKEAGISECGMLIALSTIPCNSETRSVVLNARFFWSSASWVLSLMVRLPPLAVLLQQTSLRGQAGRRP
jgi:hypothetical protein